MSEKLIIRIVPPTPGGKLDVEDAMQQVLDSITVLRAASGAPTQIHWHLDQASTNSPFQVVAEPYAQKPSENPERVARTGKRKFAAGIRSLARGRAPDWMDRSARQSVKRIMRRNTLGIGMTAYDTGLKSGPRLEVTPKIAKAAIKVLDKIDMVSEPDIPAHTAFGDVEGRLDSVGSHHGHPMLMLKSPVFGLIRCVVPEEEMERIGGRTTLEEVWKNERIIVTGRLHYEAGGKLDQVKAERLEKMEQSPVSIEQILDRDFTAGLEPHEYLKRLQDGDLD